MRCSSRIAINQSRIRQLSQAAIVTQEETTEALHTEIVQAEVIPRDTGLLQGEAFFADYSRANEGRTSLVHSEPYARRLYFHPEYKFQKTENANAKGKWFEDWLPGGKNQNFAPDTFKKFYRRNSGV